MADNGGAVFKRINFFRGFMTTEHDWNDAERYHVDKHRLHNRMFHGPGVVLTATGGLRVSARGRNELAVEIQPGYAIDGTGSDIWRPEPEIKVLNPTDFKLPQTVYLVLRYLEEPTDYVAYKENPEFKGHKRISEKSRIEWTAVEPDLNREIELARVALTSDVKKLSDAKNPHDPRENELDLRFVPIAGVVGTFLDPYTIFRIQQLAKLAVTTYSYLYHDLDIRRAGDVLYAYLTVEMLLMCNQIDLRNLPRMNLRLIDLEEEMIRELETEHPQHASTREFANYGNQIRYLRNIYQEDKTGMDLVNHIIGFQTKACEALQGLFEHKLRAKEAPRLEAAQAEVAWDKIKIRSAPFEKELKLDGSTFLMCDEIDVLNAQSEGAHAFEIRDFTDQYRSRQQFKYPDTEEGTAVKDEGVAFEGGTCQFTIKNVKLGRQLILVFRIDYTHGDWQADALVNGKKAEPWAVTGKDRKYRWRNWPYIVPGDMIDEDQVQIRFTYRSAARDINMFHVWAYQPA